MLRFNRPALSGIWRGVGSARGRIRIRGASSQSCGRLHMMACIAVLTYMDDGVFNTEIPANFLQAQTESGFSESAVGLPYLMSLANADAYRHVCFVCGKRYKSRSKLNRHVRYECGGARNQLQCRVCGRRFSRPDNLRQHSYLHTLETL